MQKFCTKCGHPLIVGNKFCTECGAPIESLMQQQTQTMPQTNQQQFGQASQAFSQQNRTQNYQSQPGQAQAFRQQGQTSQAFNQQPQAMPQAGQTQAYRQQGQASQGFGQQNQTQSYQGQQGQASQGFAQQNQQPQAAQAAFGQSQPTGNIQGQQNQQPQSTQARTGQMIGNAAMNMARNVAGRTMNMNAMPTSGEMGAGVLTDLTGMIGAAATAPGSAVGALGSAAGTAATAANFAKRSKNARTNLKADKKKLGPAMIVSAVLGLLWLVQIILMRLNIHPVPVRLLNILTFARGGVSTNPIFAIGGTLGKGVVAAGISTLATGGISKITAGAKQLFSPQNFAKINIGGYIAGIGIGLLAYQILTGYGNITGIMVGISGALLALRGSASNQNMATPLALNSSASNQNITALFSGGAIGFALAVPLALIPFVYTHLIIGIPVAIVGGILMLVSKPKQAQTF